MLIEKKEGNVGVECLGREGVEGDVGVWEDVVNKMEGWVGKRRMLVGWEWRWGRGRCENDLGDVGVRVGGEDMREVRVFEGWDVVEEVGRGVLFGVEGDGV